MGMYFGNGSPESGYDEIYLFFMVKFVDGCFKYLPQVSRYGWVGTWKFYELEQGFVDIYNWEEGEDRARSCQCAQDLHAYGDNFLITNIGGGGLSSSNSAYRSTLFLTAGYDDGININYRSFCGLDNCWTYGDYGKDNYARFTSNSFMSEYEAGKWIGMEARWKIGTLNNNDSIYEEGYYDEDGEVIYYDSKTGFRGKGEFDTIINKLVIGGNRFAQTYGLQEGDSPNSTFYIDDLIIDDQRIGPTYFQLLDGTEDTTPPICSNPQPSSNLSSGTNQTTISLDTDENADCRYSTAPGKGYSSMTNTFSTTGGKAHSQSISGLTDGQPYDYYVRCSDSTGNYNTNDFLISFSVDSVSSVCPSGADSDHDNSVSIDELIDFIDDWKNGEVTINEVIQAIGDWKNGC